MKINVLIFNNLQWAILLQDCIQIAWKNQIKAANIKYWSNSKNNLRMNNLPIQKEQNNLNYEVNILIDHFHVPTENYQVLICNPINVGIESQVQQLKRWWIPWFQNILLLEIPHLHAIKIDIKRCIKR